ncbi:MAG: membrane protein [Candidatus Entotheonella gemina]|uniref:Membrane protein n=1 Tax=Candidatus Entotheonella gemina TaxID=1429439 RepID=W4MBK4_9BACT|nr:MAG: membrane protein [Candidatus Entotheonella gemina]
MLKRFFHYIPAGLVLCLLPLAVSAESPEAKGLAIAQEADRRELGFEDTVVSLQMVLRNTRGQTSERALVIRTKEVPDDNDGDKGFVIFQQPRDVKGTALLTHTHVAKPDDQWLYLPALKRVKRISSVNKSGPFVGSEFAYEDMASQEVAKYTYRYLRDEPCGDLTCFVVERYPVYKHSGYTRQITWIDQAEYRVQKVEFYDRKEALLKTLRLSGYQQYLDKYWRASTLDMENHQTGKSTQLVFSDYQFRTGMKDRDFTPAMLKRVR